MPKSPRRGVEARQDSVIKPNKGRHIASRRNDNIQSITKQKTTTPSKQGPNYRVDTKQGLSQISPISLQFKGALLDLTGITWGIHVAWMGDGSQSLPGPPWFPRKRTTASVREWTWSFS